MIQLTGITPWTHRYYWSFPFFIFQKKVNEHFKGKVQINYLGANEVVSIFSQFNAVRSGKVDLALGISSYYTHVLPEAMAVLYTKCNPNILRKNGFYDFMRKLHREKGNVIYLASMGGAHSTAFRFFLNKKVEKCSDFKELRIRALPVYTALLNALEAEIITLKPTGVSKALDNQLIDGYGWSYGDICTYGWEDKTKYVLDHAFYSVNTSLLWNEESWNTLPKYVQTEMETIAQAVELESIQNMQKFNNIEDKLLQGLGIQKIYLSTNEAQDFLDMAYQTGWNELTQQCYDTARELKQYLSK